MGASDLPLLSNSHHHHHHHHHHNYPLYFIPREKDNWTKRQFHWLRIVEPAYGSVSVLLPMLSLICKDIFSYYPATPLESHQFHPHLSTLHRYHCNKTPCCSGLPKSLVLMVTGHNCQTFLYRDLSSITTDLGSTTHPQDFS